MIEDALLEALLNLSSTLSSSVTDQVQRRVESIAKTTGGSKGESLEGTLGCSNIVPAGAASSAHQSLLGTLG